MHITAMAKNSNYIQLMDNVKLRLNRCLHLSNFQ